MPYMIWDDKFSVGLKLIDDQHKTMIDMINSFYDNYQEDNHAAMKELLSSMTTYTQTHFKTEENLFDRYEYPHSPSHKKEHAEFIDKVTLVQKKLNRGENVLTLELTLFLKEWITGHILGSDKKYTDFFRSRGLR